MAPEQVEGKDTDARTDIFAFGAVLYEMLTGQRAFQGQEPGQSHLVHHDVGTAADLHAGAGGSRGTRSDCQEVPGQRSRRPLAECEDLAGELKWIAESASAAAPAAGDPRAASRTGRERLLWASACLLLLAAAIYAVLHSQAPPKSRAGNPLVAAASAWTILRPLQFRGLAGRDTAGICGRGAGR